MQTLAYITTTNEFLVTNEQAACGVVIHTVVFAVLQEVYLAQIHAVEIYFGIIRGEPEQAPNTQTQCTYIYSFIYLCVIFSWQRPNAHAQSHVRMRQVKVVNIAV